MCADRQSKVFPIARGAGRLARRWSLKVEMNIEPRLAGNPGD
jgi:hypothetical protein